MENIVVVKLLGQNIGYSILHSKIYSIWKPSSQFKLIDIENGYFLAKFQNKLDCEKILFESPYFIFGEYLTVQPWTMSFNPSQQFPSIFISWIKLLGLPGYLYKWKFLLAIRGLIGRVAKLDMNTNNKVRRRFARMLVYVNLDKPLVSQVLINGKIQKIEYVFLPKVCFHYRHYRHLKEVFLEKSTMSTW